MAKSVSRTDRYGKQNGIHDEVDGAELLSTAFSGSLQVIEFANIDSTDTDDLGAWSNSCHLSSDALGLLDVAADDAGIGAEVNQSTNLGTADCASSAGAEDDFVI